VHRQGCTALPRGEPRGASLDEVLLDVARKGETPERAGRSYWRQAVPARVERDRLPVTVEHQALGACDLRGRHLAGRRCEWSHLSLSNADQEESRSDDGNSEAPDHRTRNPHCAGKFRREVSAPAHMVTLWSRSVTISVRWAR
jgi:hypothetical protein